MTFVILNNGNIDKIVMIATNYDDFESIMTILSRQENWSFRFNGVSVPNENVFNRSCYAPAILTAANMELAARGVPVDLGIQITQDKDAIFGASVSFLDGEDARAEMITQVFRLIVSMRFLETLERDSVTHEIILDPLQYVFGDHFAPLPENA